MGSDIRTANLDTGGGSAAIVSASLGEAAKAVIPSSFTRILQSATDPDEARFPPTEIFNEGWMMRLVLDAFERERISGHQLSFNEGSRWYSEARLATAFRPRSAKDNLSEGFTNADGVIGRFDFRTNTRAGLKLSPAGRQFVVVEAKMFSGLSSGTRNAPVYNQVARNVACMATAIAAAGKTPDDFDRLGFFVIAPRIELRRGAKQHLEDHVLADAVKTAIRGRVAMYEAAMRPEAIELVGWEAKYAAPLIDRLVADEALAVLSWEDCIKSIAAHCGTTGDELTRFYETCLTYAPIAGRDELNRD